MTNRIRSWRPNAVQAFVVAVAALILAAAGGFPGVGSRAQGVDDGQPRRFTDMIRVDLPRGQVVTADVDCPNGYRAESGGFQILGEVNLNALPVVVSSYGIGDKWRVRGANPTLFTKDVDLVAYATCVKK